MRDWLMLTYKVPRQPSALRVQVWRKLQRLGAVLLHDSAWVLPATATTEHNFEWLAVEIREIGGEATVWSCHPLSEWGDEPFVARFTKAADEQYRRLLDALGEPGADHAALARRYQQARAVDYFGSALGERVRKKLIGSESRPKRKGRRR